jgi:hypothetical protein
MDYKKFLIAVILSGLIYLIASNALNLITQAIMPFDWATIGGMRAMNDPLLAAMFLYGFVASIGAIVLFERITLKGDLVNKGAKFGAIMWLATSVPSAFIIYTTMVYPMGFYLNSLIFGLITWMLMGIGIAWVYKQETKKKK